MSDLTAYEKMLEDGTAFKKIDMTMHSEPDIALATGQRKEKPMGNPVKKNSNNQIIERHDDYSDFDNHMEQRIQSLRNKMNGNNSNVNTRPSVNESREIALLKKRIKKIEEALMLIMETHEKLLG